MVILPSNLYGDRGTLIDTIRHLDPNWKSNRKHFLYCWFWNAIPKPAKFNIGKSLAPSPRR
jgi:hypothetical protein